MIFISRPQAPQTLTKLLTLQLFDVSTHTIMIKMGGLPIYLFFEVLYSKDFYLTYCHQGNPFYRLSIAAQRLGCDSGSSKYDANVYDFTQWL